MQTSMIPVALLAGIENAFNLLIKQDEILQQALLGFEYKLIAIDLEGSGLFLYCRFLEQGVEISHQQASTADATLHGAPFTLLRVLLSNDTDAALKGDIRISGDTALIQQLTQRLRNTGHDWEEILSKLCGDILAHKVATGLRDLLGWQQRSQQHIQQDIHDFLLYETQSLASGDEVEHYNKAVDRLREDTDRVQARIKRLESRTEQPPSPGDAQ